MRRLLLLTCLVAVLQEARGTPVLQVPVKTKGQHWAPEQDTEKAWGIQVEPPEKDGQLVGLLPVLKLKPAASAEKLPGVSAWVDTEDILASFRNPQPGPEPDLDSLYHPPLEESQGEETPRLWVMPPRQVLQGPEEDLDHIHHPADDSWGP